MTSFVHVDQPATHPGVARAEAVIDHIRAARRSFDGARGLAALLLAAIVASLLVVADKLMSTWNDGGLLVAWLVLWGVAFAAIAFFAGTARSLAVRAMSGVHAAARRRAAARADDEFMAFAKHDPRILRDLQAIASRQEADTAEESAANATPTLYQAMRRVNLGQYY
jgi:CRP-like cAMP-binding protein